MKRHAFRSKSKTLAKSSQEEENFEALKRCYIPTCPTSFFFLCYKAAHTKIRHCLHSNCSNLRRKHISKFPTAINLRRWVLGRKHKRFREFRTPFTLRNNCENPRSNSRACAASDGAICSRNRKIVPYHGVNPNTRNGARLRSPSLIMAPDTMAFLV